MLTRMTTSRWAAAMIVAAGMLSLAPVAAGDDPPRELTVSPAAEPTPVLRYRLMPAPAERRAGKAAPIYFRAMVLLGQRVSWRGDGLPAGDVGDRERVRHWLDADLHDLPIDEVRQLLNNYSEVFAEIDHAARHERADWQPRLSEGIHALLPELGQMRALARLTALRARVAIQQGALDEAIAALRTGYAMSEHMGELPVLLGSHVAWSIALMMASVTEELIAAEHAPNLYWALASRRDATANLRAAIATDRRVIYMMAPELERLPTTPLPRAEADRLWAMTFEAWATDVDLTNPLAATSVGLLMYPRARERLLERGVDPDHVEAMPVKQALLHYWLEEFEHWADEMVKWSYLPYTEAIEPLGRSEDEMVDAALRGAVANPFLHSFISVSAAFGTGARTQHRFALLRAIEAIRMHVAETGTLPDALAEVTVVPVPTDPITGEPFAYERDGDTFTLKSAEPTRAHGTHERAGVRVRVRAVRP